MCILIEYKSTIRVGKRGRTRTEKERRKEMEGRKEGNGMESQGVRKEGRE